MNKKNVLAITICFAIILSTYNLGHTFSSQAPSGHTGGPGEVTCAKSGCHTGAPNTGPGNVGIAFSESSLTYEAGNVYDITITVEDGAKSRFGFQAVALTDNETQAGAFVENDDNLGISTSNGKEYIAHRNVADGNSNTFSFQWLAPQSGTGAVTFYASGNATNGNFSTSGDNVYTTSLTVTEQEVIASNFEEIATIQTINTYPNPAMDFCTVSYTLTKADNITLQLQDLSGQLITQASLGRQNIGNYQHTFHVNNSLAKGIYLLTIQGQTAKASQRIVVQ